MAKSKQWTPMPRFLLRKDAINQLTKAIKLSNKNVLEIGFGAGEMLRWFHKKGALVTGIDFSEEAREMARERLSSYEQYKSIKLQSDFKQLKKESFDVICAFEVLEHIEDDVGAINEWLGYLKPGGSLLISVPAHMSKWCRNDVWAGHIKRYEKDEFKEIITGNQAVVKAIWNYGYPVIIILDKLLNRNRKNNKDNQLSVIEKTQKSGVDRPNNWAYKLISNNVVLYPTFLLQRMFFNYDLGSGYLVHVKKSNTQ